MTFNVIVIVIITIAIMFVVLRVLYVIYWSSKPFCAKSTKPFSTLIILGSGGHTAEMLNLLSVLQADRFNPRYYIAAATDNMSLQKARVFEECLADKIGNKAGGSAQFMQIYRSREVGQSYVTSIGTTLLAIAHALWLMMKIKPQVILCNGPGTCIPLCVIAVFFKVLGIRWSSIFYVESISASEEAFSKWLTSLQVTHGRSVICAMATTTKEVSSSSLCGLSHVIERFQQASDIHFNLCSFCHMICIFCLTL